MSKTNSVARSLHDVGLAAWFGGSLMGAVALNGAAASIPEASQRTQVAVDGWKRWAPINAVAIGAHLLGGVLVIKGNKGRIAGQSGVGTASAVKTGFTLAAVGATVAAGFLGTKVEHQFDAPTEGATEPSSETPLSVAKAQRQLRIVQWAIPALTGALVVVGARMGEQQRPSQVASGVLARILPD